MASWVDGSYFSVRIIIYLMHLSIPPIQVWKKDVSSLFPQVLIMFGVSDFYFFQRFLQKSANERLTRNRVIFFLPKQHIYAAIVANKSTVLLHRHRAILAS
jgi:hypothetical protein